MAWAGHITHMEEMRNVYKVLVGGSEDSRSLSVDRIIILKQIDANIDCIHLA
jgi:hypothetical protein